MRREDSLARPGGEESAVPIENLHPPEDALNMCERILATTRRPFDSAGP